MLYTGIRSSFLLLVAIRIGILSYKQQIKILIPPATSLCVNAILFFIVRYIKKNYDDEHQIYTERTLFYPICSTIPLITKTPALISLSIIAYFSKMFYLVSMTCSFMVYRFHIHAAYYPVLFLERVVM